MNKKYRVILDKGVPYMLDLNGGKVPRLTRKEKIYSILIALSGVFIYVLLNVAMTLSILKGAK